MKKLLSILFISLPLFAQAQFVVGAQGMTIKSYALVCIDGLILSPGSDLTLSNNQLSRSTSNQPVGSGNTLDRVYTFSTPISYSGVMGLRYSDAELAGNTENAMELIYSSANTGNVWLTVSGSNVNITDNIITNSVVNTTLARISATSATPLPVRLVAFTAHKDEKEQSALLHWDVANEENFSGYYVEHSTDGRVFTQIGMVKAEGKANYSFTDSSPAEGMNYYRLRLADLNGSYAYSPVRTLSFGINNVQLNVYPNPVKNENITIHTTDKTLDGKSGIVTDVAGKLILSFKLTGAKTLINTNDWMPGGYLIRLENGMAFKIVKQ